MGYNNNPKFSGINWGTIFAQGIASFAPVVAGLAAGGAPGTVPATNGPSCNHPLPMHGQGQIAGCLDTIHAAWVAAGAQPGVTVEQMLTVTRGLLTQLTDPATFTQGDAYLTQFQGVLRQEIARLTTLIQQQGGTITTNAAGDIVVNTPATATAQIITGVPNSYLIGGAVAVIGLIAFTRK